MQGATARQSDVDENSVELISLNVAERYDHGKVSFRAKEGKLLDLEKLLETIKGTRLGEGTRSELLKFEVTAAGTAVREQDQWKLKVDGSEDFFLLAKLEKPDDEADEAQEAARVAEAEEDAFAKLQQAVRDGKKLKSVTGELDDWSGTWPEFLAKERPKPWRILVTSFEIAEPE